MLLLFSGIEMSRQSCDSLSDLCVTGAQYPQSVFRASLHFDNSSLAVHQFKFFLE